MDLLSSILLGLLQGLTEFLPVSSSGHLVLAQHLLGYQGSTHLAFDLLVHVATLLAVLIYFRRDILLIVSTAWRPSGEFQGRRWLIMIAAGTVPTVIIGFAFQNQFESLFGKPRLVAVMLWVTALLLLASDRRKTGGNTGEKLTILRSIIVGTTQGLAIIPGISRSGSTIAVGIFSGLHPEQAARFSFLLSIPAILGASLLEMQKISEVSAQNLAVIAAGMAVAFLSGYLAIHILLKMVVKRRLWKFSLYLFLLGGVGLLLT